MVEKMHRVRLDRFTRDIWKRFDERDPALLRAAIIRRRRVLAAIGAPIASAAQWPHGALRFPAKFDKRGHETLVPLSRDARSALDVYLGLHPRARMCHCSHHSRTRSPCRKDLCWPMAPARRDARQGAEALAWRLAPVPPSVRGGYAFRRGIPESRPKRVESGTPVAHADSN
jgi:hypothetical protein